MWRTRTWAIAAGLFGFASAFSTWCFVAAASLGYDMYPGGKRIIMGWLYSAVACLLGVAACSTVVWRRRRRTKESAA